VDDISTGAPGYVEGPGVEGAWIIFCSSIAFMDVIKKPGVAAPPAVDGLLDVTYLEERAVLGDVLYHLVDKGLYDGPLQVAGILKLVQEPVVEAAIKTVVNPEAFKFVGFLAEDR